MKRARTSYFYLHLVLNLSWIKKNDKKKEEIRKKKTKSKIF